MRAFVPVANRFIRPLNTDWKYAARTLPALSNYCPELEIVIQDNRLVDAACNLRYALSIARSRGFHFTPRRWDYRLEQDCPVYASDVRSAKPGAILCYERYPSNDYGLPVVWITSYSAPEILRDLGLSITEISDVLAWKHSRAKRAARLVFTTEVSRRNFVAQNGESLNEKSVVIPFLITGITPVQDISKKWNEKQLRILFVGREARRKGLPATLSAVVPLLSKYPDLSFTIVSSMDDGVIDIPTLQNLKVHRETSRQEVLRLMADSHVLVMPSSRESYGFVYIEAMSQGCVPLALDLPVQRELIGNDGILLSGQETSAIAGALMEVMGNRTMFFQKAASGLLNFQRKHSPEVIAARFADVLRATQKRL